MWLSLARPMVICSPRMVWVLGGLPAKVIRRVGGVKGSSTSTSALSKVCECICSPGLGWAFFCRGEAFCKGEAKWDSLILGSPFCLAPTGGGWKAGAWTGEPWNEGILTGEGLCAAVGL